ncbi:MAG: mechanosensitive ion channel [Lachnospiraceae bacterium]|nr:mechanosensitive ion channel [Lachnospiraceae bacterium]
MNLTEGLQDITDASEEAKDVVQGFIDDLPAKLMDLGFRIVVTIILLLLGRYLINILRKLVKTALTKAGIDRGVIQFIDSFIGIALWLVVIATIAVNYGIDAASVVALLGSAGIAIGLSLQGALSNLAGGILILLIKPFKVGDYIIEHTSEKEGVVTEINIFYTHLITIDNKLVVVPNGRLADTSLTNLTRFEFRKLDQRVAISYDSDIKKAKDILCSLLEENENVLEDHPIDVFVDQLGESAIILGYRAFVKTGAFHPARWELNESIKQAFDEAGIVIPYNQLDVHVKEK